MIAKQQKVVEDDGSYVDSCVREITMMVRVSWKAR